MISLINEKRKKILRKRIALDIKNFNPKKILDNGGSKKGSFDYGMFENRIILSDISIGIDCQDLPYKSNSFDCVIFAGVIQYVNNPQKALKECRRVLKKGGALIISTINKNSLIKKITGFKDEKNIFDCQEFRDFIKMNKFDILDKDIIDFPFIPKRYGLILYFLCKKL